MDVFFEPPGEWVCAEVKGVHSDKDDIIRGVFQCVKYRAVLEAKRHYEKLKKLPRVRVILVLAGKPPDGLNEFIGPVLGIELVSGVVAPEHFTVSAP